MSNHRQSNDFIKTIAKAVQKNNYKPSHELFNYIWRILLLQNVSRDDLNKNLFDEGMFSRWCRKERTKTYTFVQPDWNYFCQFISADNKAMAATNHIKVYVPLDYEHIERGVNELFDFLEENNISHISKVGSKIKSDDVVIRLINKEDLYKLLDFIKNNKYLQEGLLKPNPFAYNEGNIALVCDGILSYNETLANYIMLYVKKLIETNCVKQASLKGFYRFVIEYYAQTFVEERNPERPYALKKFANDFSYVDNKEIDINDPFVITDYKYVTKLIIESQAKDYKLDNFVSHYETINKKKKIESSVKFENADNMLSKLIEILVEKCDSNYTTWNIIEYINTGDYTYLTTFGNSRNMVCNSTFRDDILYMLKMKNISVNDYVQSFYNKMFVLDDNVMNIIKEYLAYGDYKYGREDTREYLDGYVSTCNDAYITRDSDFRDRFTSLKVADKVRLFMKATGKRIDDVIEMCRPRKK